MNKNILTNHNEFHYVTEV